MRSGGMEHYGGMRCPDRHNSWERRRLGESSIPEWPRNLSARLIFSSFQIKISHSGLGDRASGFAEYRAGISGLLFSCGAFRNIFAARRGRFQLCVRGENCSLFNQWKPIRLGPARLPGRLPDRRNSMMHGKIPANSFRKTRHAPIGLSAAYALKTDLRHRRILSGIETILGLLLMRTKKTNLAFQ